MHTKYPKGDQKIWYHLVVHLCTGMGAKKLSVNAEDFVIYTILFVGLKNKKESAKEVHEL